MAYLSASIIDLRSDQYQCSSNKFRNSVSITHCGRMIKNISHEFDINHQSIELFLFFLTLYINTIPSTVQRRAH